MVERSDAGDGCGQGEYRPIRIPVYIGAVFHCPMCHRLLGDFGASSDGCNGIEYPSVVFCGDCCRSFDGIPYTQHAHDIGFGGG